MNRRIVALALGAALVLAGACGGNNDAGSDETPDTAETEYAPEDLALVDVPVSKPPADLKVDAAALPQEVAHFSAVTGLTPDQQQCVNGAMKQAIDADPSITKAPGKVASLGGNAMVVCDASAIFTDQLIQGLAAADAEGASPVTEQQMQCLKDAFAADSKATAKMISGSVGMQLNAIREALEPIQAKCGVDLTKDLPETP